MKFFVKIFVLTFCLLYSNICLSETYIVYLNLEKIMSVSKAGKSITEQLEKIHKSNISHFKKKEAELKKKEEEIIAQKNIISKEEFEKKITDLRSKVKDYRKERNDRINSLTKKRIEATAELVDGINPILAEYSTEKSISIIIQKKNIVLGKSDLDITNDILKIVDKKIKTIKLN